MQTFNFNQSIQLKSKVLICDSNDLARVTAVHKDSYEVFFCNKICRAEITGNLRYTTQSSDELPAVGDWVKAMPMDSDSAILLEVYERSSLLKRKAAGKASEAQVIAANIDYAFICSACDHNFNMNRIDRFITLCYSSQITPIVVLTKTDLIQESELTDLLNATKQRYPELTIKVISNLSPSLLSNFKHGLKKDKTYCFLGSSGVGKSTIINALLNSEVLKTKHLSNSNNKGRHTTTHRALFEIDNGSFVIDTPGMREVGITSSANALEHTFSSIHLLANQCKFQNCSHENEKGCAILEAVNSGHLNRSEYNNYIKLVKEEAHYTKSEQERRQDGKDLSKLIKHFKKGKRASEF